MLAGLPDNGILLAEDAPRLPNPIGVKGAGEGGITVAGATIAAAVDDALLVPPPSSNCRSLPPRNVCTLSCLPNPSQRS